MQELISVCIPTYNGSRFLKDALSSIKNQGYKNFEVIISDDNSADDTLLICDDFKRSVDFPVHILSHAPAGIGANWNNCIRNSNGRYIKFLFQDDVLEADCLHIQLDKLKNSDACAISCARTIIDESSQLSNDRGWLQYYGNLRQRLKFANDGTFMFSKKSISLNHDLDYNIFGEPDTFLYRREIFDSVGLFNEELNQILDLEFSYRMLKKGNILLQSDFLLKFRLHDGQASAINKRHGFLEQEQLKQWVRRNFFMYISFKEKLSFFKNILKKVIFNDK